MKVDCHIHSLYSDGVYTVRELIPRLLEEGIELFSITDHDTADGIKEARELSRGKMRFIPGIEFTCREFPFSPSGKSFSIHLLGYGFHEEDEELLCLLQSRKEKVENVFRQLCGELSRLGCPVSVEEIPVSCGIVLQLCDVEDFIRSRYPDAGQEIYKKIQSWSSKLNQVNIPVKTAVDAIHKAGGKAVWAHPFYVYKDFQKMGIDQEEVLAALDALKQMEVDGVEAWYSAFCPEETSWLRREAGKRGMICSAGSDFHGSEGRSRLGMEVADESGLYQ